MSKVIVLGAKGKFGRAAVAAFADAGWEVTAFGRRWQGPVPPGVAVITGDAADPDALGAACAGKDVIVNAAHPLYKDWVVRQPVLTRAVIAAAKSSGAAVIQPGNIYNYGADAPELLREDTPWHPSTRKGRVRVEMEQALRDAGVPTIVLRGGDFIEAAKSGSWFDALIAARAARGRVSYPGPVDRLHAWAYLPDMARAAVMLAEIRANLPQFCEVNFPGYTLTGEELGKAIGDALGKPQKTSCVPWILVWLLGVFDGNMREVREMRYLWQMPHRLDGTRLGELLPGFRPTPLADAMRQVLAS